MYFGLLLAAIPIDTLLINFSGLGERGGLVAIGPRTPDYVDEFAFS